MRKGAALPATLFALAITSAMAVGGLYVARRHKASVLDGAVAATLRPRAESAVVEAVVGWDSLARAEQAIGSSVTLDSTADLGIWVTRTGEFGYLVVAEARTRTPPPFHHRIGLSLVVSAGRPQMPFPRAWTLLP